MTSFGAEESDARTLFASHIVKSDDLIGSQQRHQNQNVACQPTKDCILAATEFCNIFDGSPVPPRWRSVLGFLLTLVHFAGVIVIIVLYYRHWNDDRRPLIFDAKFVSPQRVINDSDLSGYICKCDIPAYINDAEVPERKKCYEPKELQDLDVLQFSTYTGVKNIIGNINNKTIKKRTFMNGSNLDWESYELVTSRLDDSTFEHPLTNLSDQLNKRGYLGETGYITVDSLADEAFFTVPQGFIKADVDYNCTNCTACQDLWAKYNYTEATRQVEWHRQEQDVGWIFCYSSSQCGGSCRFFRTYFKPWGIALHDIAVELQESIPGDSEIFFQSRVFYANISRLSIANQYVLEFLEIERDGTSWAKLVDIYTDIPACKSDEVVVCSGTSICATASVFSQDSVNSETQETVCENYATREDFQINQQKCRDTVKSLKTHNESELARVCGQFKCAKVQAAEVHWNNHLSLQGEVALSKLTWKPAFQTFYNPALCSNSYSQVHVQYDESQNEILAIYEANCIRSNSSANSEGCWLTGRYKNMTATQRDNWEMLEFSPEEVTSNETLFACYRFDKKSIHSYLYDKVGIVAGTLGSWLLILSCIFWTAIRTVPSEFRSNAQLLSTRSDSLEMGSFVWSRSQSLEDTDSGRRKTRTRDKRRWEDPNKARRTTRAKIEQG